MTTPNNGDTVTIDYVLKRRRFVYNVSLSCVDIGVQVTLELAGGKVGSSDQAEFYVPSPSAGTAVSASMTVDCGAGPSTS